MPKINYFLGEKNNEASWVLLNVFKTTTTTLLPCMSALFSKFYFGFGSLLFKLT